MQKIALASASPRRKALLKKLFSNFVIFEAPPMTKQPKRCAKEETVAKAEFKAQWVALRNPNTYVIGADTIVQSTGKFGKPKNEKSARRMLKAISAKKVRVYTSICIAFFDGNKKIRKRIWTEYADLSFRKISDKEIEEYLRSKKWIGKAGGFNVAQMPAKSWIEKVEGDINTAVGLPLTNIKKEIRLL
ncbi:MAG: Maf family protein [Candidatus Micrarchaeia archaeon]|jgi:septum formation protein